MREIKFRAWHEKFGMCDAKKMSKLYLNLTFDGCVLYELHTIESMWKVMQFTGTKDCFGTEIYEGDIVFLDSKMLKGEIVMDFFAWKMKSGDEFFWLCDYPDDFHVIGNIYENLDLLERVDEK